MFGFSARCLSLVILLGVSLINHVQISSCLNANRVSKQNENTCYKSVGYWGQNSVGLRFPKDQWEKPLKEYCNDDTWDMIIVSFMNIFYNGEPPLPGLNFAYHCENAPFSGYPFLLQCPGIAQDIKTCQAQGKVMLLSMGGAAGSYQFPNEQSGKDYADLIWNMFMGGNDPSAIRPFGNIVFDGIDLDIEGGSPVGYTSFVKRMRELYDTDQSKVYYIAGAPQCPYPDAYLGPTGTYSNYALGNTWFDFIFVQFYNNFCGIQNYPNSFNFDQWHSWAQEAKTQVYIGVPGATFSGSGYQSPSKVKQILKDVISKYGVDKEGWFGGFMTWDIASSVQNIEEGSPFGPSISKFLKESSPTGSCSQVSSPSPPPPSPPPAAPQNFDPSSSPLPASPIPSPPSPPPSSSPDEDEDEYYYYYYYYYYDDEAISDSISISPSPSQLPPSSVPPISPAPNPPIAPSTSQLPSLIASSSQAVIPSPTPIPIPQSKSPPAQSQLPRSPPQATSNPVTRPSPSPLPPPKPPSPPSTPKPPPSSSGTKCNCQASNGFPKTRVYGHAAKKCPRGSVGNIVISCLPLPKNKCRWGTARYLCFRS